MRIRGPSQLVLTTCLCLLLTQASEGQRGPPYSVSRETGDTPKKDKEFSLKDHVKIFESPNKDEGQEFWNNQAQDELLRTLTATLNTNVAKNVILFLGDGMGLPTITASRIYKGQQQFQQSGEEQQLVFETFPHVALSKTYCVDRQVADSACTATAYLSGVKTRYQTLGVDASVTREDCVSMTDQSKLASMAGWALQAGKRAGLVTSTRVTHATPGGVYAHTPSRKWECNAKLPQEAPQDCPNFKDIARQLVEDEPGQSLHVILGGGYQTLTSGAQNATGDPVDDEECVRDDGRDLFQVWQELKSIAKKSYRAVRTKSELMNPKTSNVDYLMGIFANSHLPYEYEKKKLGLDMPTLAEMTREAIKVLTRGDHGFFLLVEGGRIDHAHHETTARKALEETLAFEEALETALDMLGTEETLFVVTADHSHVMTINGYPERGQDVTGLGDIGEDGLPYTTLMYTNGAGFNYTMNSTVPEAGARWNITGDDVSNIDYHQLSAVPLERESHGGEDVIIYAKGPMAHLFHGVHEQNYIAHAMAYAACLGANRGHCERHESSAACPPAAAVTSTLLYCVLLAVAARRMMLHL